MARICLLIFAFLIALPYPAQAAEKELVGTLIEIEGGVYDSSGNQPYKIDDPVHLNDSIVTGPQSRALILFIDDTQLTLGENASLLVDNYIYDPDESGSSTGNFNILKGSFLFVSGLITKTANPNINIETSAGSIGIRGTTVWGGDLDEEYGVFVQDGEVTVTNNRDSVIVPKGQGSFIRNQFSPPGQPKAWKKAKIDRAIGTIALKNKLRAKQRVAYHKQMNVVHRRHHKDVIRKKHGQHHEQHQDKMEKHKDTHKDRAQKAKKKARKKWDRDR